MKYYGIFSFLILVSFVHSLPARAEEPPRVFLSEINWAGSEASTADEWIELVNLEDRTVDLSNWVVTGIGTSGGAIAIPSGTTVPAKGTVLIANYASGDAKSTLATSPTLVTTAVSIANSNLDIILAMPDGLVCDRYQDSGTPDFGKTSPMTSIERNLTDFTWNSATASKNLTKSTQLGTPGAATFPVASVPVSEPEPETPVETPVDEPVETTPVVEEVPVAVPETVPEVVPVIVEAPNCACPAPVEIPVATPVSTATTEPVTQSAPAPVPEEPQAPQFAAYAPGTLLINEIVSDPSEGEEWLEIMNPGAVAITLNGFTLKDATSHVTALPEATLPAQGYLVIEKPNGNLNNTGDTMSLFDGQNNLIDTVTYGTDNIPLPKKGEAVARDAGGAWTKTSPTKGSQNIFPQSTETYDTETTSGTPADLDNSQTTQETVGTDDGLPSEGASTPGTYHIIAVAAPVETGSTTGTSGTETAEPTVQMTEIDTVGTLEEGTRITVEGVVVVPPNLFAKQTAFLNGLELYFNKADWPNMPAGTLVRISGEVGKSNGNMRLKIKNKTDITVLGTQTPDAHELATLSETEHGALVTVTGKVEDKVSKNWIILSDGGEEITATFGKNVTSPTALTKGTTVTLTGVIKKTESGAILTLRGDDDVTVLASEAADVIAPVTPAVIAPAREKKTPLVGGGLLTTSVGALGYWYFRSKGITLPFLQH